MILRSFFVVANKVIILVLCNTSNLGLDSLKRFCIPLVRKSFCLIWFLPKLMFCFCFANWFYLKSKELIVWNEGSSWWGWTKWMRRITHTHTSTHSNAHTHTHTHSLTCTHAHTPLSLTHTHTHANTSFLSTRNARKYSPRFNIKRFWVSPHYFV